MNLAQLTYKLICEMEDTQMRLNVSPKVTEQRTKICKSCSHYQEKEQICGLCGCYVPAKSAQLFESCPVEKWMHDGEMWEKEYFEFFLSKVIEKHPEAEQWKQSN